VEAPCHTLNKETYLHTIAINAYYRMSISCIGGSIPILLIVRCFAGSTHFHVLLLLLMGMRYVCLLGIMKVVCNETQLGLHSQTSVFLTQGAF
jgi:hypothetical protein